MKEAQRRPMRLVLREHEALPNLPLWCSCGHRATTPYNRESHLIEAILTVPAPQTVDETEHPDLVRLRKRVEAAVEHGYTEGDVNHNVQPIVGMLRLFERDGRVLEGEDIGYTVEKLMKACAAETAWLNTPAPPVTVTDAQVEAAFWRAQEAGELPIARHGAQDLFAAGYRAALTAALTEDGVE